MKLIHLEIDRLARRHEIIFLDFINKIYPHKRFDCSQLNYQRREEFLWISYHHRLPPLLLRSRDTTFRTCFFMARRREWKMYKKLFIGHRDLPKIKTIK